MNKQYRQFVLRNARRERHSLRGFRRYCRSRMGRARYADGAVDPAISTAVFQFLLAKGSA